MKGLHVWEFVGNRWRCAKCHCKRALSLHPPDRHGCEL